MKSYAMIGGMLIGTLLFLLFLLLQRLLEVR